MILQVPRNTVLISGNNILRAPAFMDPTVSYRFLKVAIFKCKQHSNDLGVIPPKVI